MYNNTSWRKPFQFIYLFILFITTCNSIINENNNNKYFNVVDFGAKGDGKTFDTIAIQRAVRAVAHEGSGTIIFPKNKIFLTGPFLFILFWIDHARKRQGWKTFRNSILDFYEGTSSAFRDLLK